nr:uncharacterized protein LOC107967660 [Pan troglodytes]
MRGDVGSWVLGGCCSHSRSCWAASAAWCRPPPHAEMSPRVPSSAPLRGAAAPANREPRCASVGCHSAVNRQSTVCWPRAPQLSVNLSVNRQRAAFLRSYVPWFIHSETSEVFLEEMWLQTL